MARCCAALEVLDDDHAAAAAWTAIDRWLVNIGGISTGGLILWHREQLASASDVVGTRGFGEQAVMADAVEAFGQHMDEEAADELVDGEGHRLVSRRSFAAVVLPLEGDAVVVEREQAAVGDGDAVRIAGQISQHRLGSAEWALGIDHPFGFP
jgi:hypothetical protein